MPIHRRQHIPPVRDLMTMAERRRPAVTRREWGALAIAAAARAGLEAPDLAALRKHLENQHAIDDEEEALRG